MTYRRLFYLKYKKGVSTQDLVRQYPNILDRVSEVALLDIPEEVLKEIVREEETLQRLIKLKKQLSKYLSQKKAA